MSKFPAWLTCGFPNAAAWYEPRGSLDVLKVWDYSNSNDKGETYKNYLNTHKEKFHEYVFEGHGEPLRRWFSPGLVEPTWFATQGNITRKHSDLFRLVAAANMMLEKKPNHTQPEAIGLRACVSYPNALLLAQSSFVNISQNGNSFRIICSSCKLTNCITSSEPKDLGTVIIVRRPPFVMLP